ATLIFICAIVHTFLASKFMNIAHEWEHEHQERIMRGEAEEGSVHFGAELFHFLGEVEVVFGVWAFVLIIAILLTFGWPTVVNYFSHGVNFTEPAFVVVIMTLAATRPILRLAESMMWKVAALFGGTLAALWFTILTIGPLLGSFITEPAAITISALVLSNKFYELNPSSKLKYATLGLLFVNISVGGTLTHFAAPPVLMVSGPWNWGTEFMITHFGWKALLGILISNGLYFLYFRKELASLEERFALRILKDRIESKYVTFDHIRKEFDRVKAAVESETGILESINEKTSLLTTLIRERMEKESLPKLSAEGIDEKLIREAFEKRFEEMRLKKIRRYLPGVLPEDMRPEFIDPDWDKREDPVPYWVTAVHLIFMAWTIVNSHHTQLFVLGLLFFLGFAQITAPYQNRVNLQPAMLVGFFLAGLVIHGGLQGWWIAPVLGGLKEFSLMLGATILTGFNDNAAITYLSTLVPNFTDSLKYAVVAGAVTGGGLTVIANAPNPAGQSILKKHFNDAVSPIGLFLAAFLPTVVMFLCFWYLG
ncbi:MAG TPA: putative Na+/H+ antiporter, partial [Thermodesulfobacteriota bacterium]|nr:putative Na+/H+ antiporter [Thermodesulfobacteriota bacterium]